MKPLTAGLELGSRFVLLRRLGEGGQGEVWLAEDREAARRVALKFLPDEEATAEFERMRLAPAGAVEVYGLHEEGGRRFCALEYVAGGDLGQFRGRSYRSFLPALQGVAAQLAQLHALGTTHGDLKCGNVLIDAAGNPRLADFGRATRIGELPPSGGSPYNQGPQRLRGEPAAPADDLYALGAMLYELLAASPPFYPAITRDKVLYEPPPQLVPRQPTPEGLRRLALRLLAKSAAERPASMDEVAALLAAAAQEPPDEPAAPASAATATMRTDAAGPWRHWKAAAGLAAVAVAAAALFTWLSAGERAPDASLAASAAKRATEQLAARREQAAQDEREAGAAVAARDEFDRRLAELERRGAPEWDAATFATARAAGAQASVSFSLGESAAAKAAWQRGLSAIETLEAALPKAYDAALARGRAALAAARIDEARAALTLAAKIRPENAAPGKELQRLARYDEALALVDAAALDERAGRPAAAADKYRRALALDAGVPGASAALARLSGAAAGDAYATAMAQGLDAQAAGRIDAAREAFERARRLQPTQSAPAAALAALERGNRAASVTSLARRAALAESGERWSEAVTLWRSLAELEPALANAREGIARAEPRAALDERLEGLIASPERLLSDSGRGEGRSLLASAAAIAAPGPRLAAQQATLRDLVEAATRPVRLALESDGATEVVVYRVGRFGTFARRELELLPGRYTVVGSRPGYRDVRREVVVKPGGEPPLVQVRCEERI